MSLLRNALLLAVVAALAALSAGAASGSRHLMVGLTDHAAALNADPRFFTNVGALHAEVLRVNLSWGGPLGVARRKPANGADPDDPAYDWRRYDRVVLNAARQRVRIAFSIFATPSWANRGRGRNRRPDNLVHLEKFAYAAAARYSGTWQRREDDVRLPPVRLWIAWNEPNLNLGLVPQFRKVRGKWVIQSARDYAGICNAIYDGVHVTGAHGPAGRVRSDRAPRQQRAGPAPPLGLAARVPPGDEALRGAYVRRLRAPALLRRAAGDAQHAPARPDGGHARQHRRAREGSDAALRPEADLADRVRVPDPPARPDLRRLLGTAGPLPRPGLRDRAAASPHRHAALVPGPRRGADRRLAVRAA